MVVSVDEARGPAERFELFVPRPHGQVAAVVVDHEERQVVELERRRQEDGLPVRTLVQLGVARQHGHALLGEPFGAEGERDADGHREAMAE